MQMRVAISRGVGFCLCAFLIIRLYGTMDTYAQPGANRPASAGLEPAADVLLHKMSEKLANAKQFTVTGKRTMDAALAQGRPVNLNVTCELSLRRPNLIVAQIAGDVTSRTFYYDGARITLLDKAKNLYATVESAGTIDAMLDDLHEKYGFTPPLADFLVQDPYTDLTRNVLSGRVQGREAVGGKECHHLAFTQDTVDWDLWLATEDLLPCKFVLIQKSMTGRPRLEVMFIKWDLAPQLEDGAFKFKPPQGAEKIEMLPIQNGKTATAGQANKQERER